MKPTKFDPAQYQRRTAAASELKKQPPPNSVTGLRDRIALLETLLQIK